MTFEVGKKYWAFRCVVAVSGERFKYNTPPFEVKCVGKPETYSWARVTFKPVEPHPKYQVIDDHYHNEWAFAATREEAVEKYNEGVDQLIAVSQKFIDNHQQLLADARAKIAKLQKTKL